MFLGLGSTLGELVRVAAIQADLPESCVAVSVKFDSLGESVSKTCCRTGCIQFALKEQNEKGQK